MALDPTETLLASASHDQTIALWHLPSLLADETVTQSAVPQRTLVGHSGAVYTVLFQDPNTLISGSQDETLRLWATDTGVCLHTLRADRRYEHMDITGVTGITAAQRASLKALGAVESTESADLP